MTTPKNTSLTIGAFIVGALVLVFIALLFFSGGQLFSHKKKVIMYFEGSVQGLQVGAPVKLKGVVLGEITDIRINFENDGQPLMTAVTADLVMARISRKGTEVDNEFWIESIQNGLRAQLNYQSFLTGLLYVELDFFPDSTLKIYNFQDDYLELPTVATGFEEISKNLQEMNVKGLIDNLDNLVVHINKIVANGSIQETIVSINNAAKSIDKTATNLDKEVAQLSKNLSTTSTELNLLLRNINDQAPGLGQQLSQNLLALQKSLDQFTQTTQTLNHTFSEDAPLVNQLTITLQDISNSARAFRNLSETLEQQPEAIWRGKNSPEVDN
jgi:paraquat-inducible protein B